LFFCAIRLLRHRKNVKRHRITRNDLNRIGISNDGHLCCRYYIYNDIFCYPIYVNAYSASTKSPSINNIIKITGFNCVQLSQANQLLTKHMPMLGLGSIVDFHNKVSALALYFTCLNENGYSRYDMLMMISIGAESLKGLSIESLRRWRVGEMSSSVTVGENPLCIPLRYTTYIADAQKCSQKVVP